MTIPTVTFGETAEVDWANAVADAVNPTDWQIPTLESGWGSWYTDTREVQIRREGDIVRVQGLLRRTGSTLTTGQTNIFQLPEGMRPAAGKFFACYSNGSGGGLCEIRINAAGAGGGWVVFDGTGHDAVTNAYLFIDHIAFSINAVDD